MPDVRPRSQPPRLYQSPPGSGHNDGALPKAWDPTYQTYTNLTAEQLVAFQSMVPALLVYAGTRRWLAQVSGISASTSAGSIPLATYDYDRINIEQLMEGVNQGVQPVPVTFITQNTVYNLSANDVTILYTTVTQFTSQLFSAHAQAITGINNGTITTRAQIDALYAPIAPNSPSATNPSPT